MKNTYKTPYINNQLLYNFDLITASNEEEETGPHENTYEDISGVFNWNS